VLQDRGGTGDVGRVAIHLNSAERLPPVGCWLVIMIEGVLVRAIRTGIIAKKTDDMEYRTEDGRLIYGRYEWTYP